ncbi:MAG: Uma2 family endonuclease [Myxococcota bacterium]
MSPPAHRVRYTYAEYLAFEAASNVKHEYLAGQIYGMAGGSPDHAALAATVIGLLFGQLVSGRCRAFDSDLRVRVPATGLATYPDVTVICGPREHHEEDDDAITNPTAIFEVLSPSTEGYDRGDKFEHYQRLPSLQHFILVSQDTQEIEVWTKSGQAWERRLAKPGKRVELPAIGAMLDVSDLYDAAAAPRI